MFITPTLLLAAAAHQTTEIRGTVTTGGRPLPEAAVWLETDEPFLPKPGTVRQKNKVFRPHITIVPVGSEIKFPNEDDVYHNVYAEFNAKRFDLGIYPKGQSRSVTFDKVGVVSVLCNIHADMSAYILVVKSKHFALTDAKGRYTIKGVGAKEGTLHAWHETRKTGTKTWAAGPGDIEITVAR